MSGFSELIKNFDKTRDYVRDFFIYGFKVRGEVGKKSSRTYDDEKRRVESWLRDYVTTCSNERGKQMYISVESSHISENPLYNAFYSKSFTDNDIKLHFMIADVLTDGKKLGVRKITETINNRFDELFDEQTVRGKMSENTDEGLFTSEKDGRNILYSMAENNTCDCLDGIEGVWDAISFFSENSPFSVIGNSIMKSAGRKNECFLNKHNYIVHTLEDEVLLSLVSAIDKKCVVNVTNSNGKSEIDVRGVPLRILVSAASGRRYVVMYVIKSKRFLSLRLDCVKSVKHGELCDNFDYYAEKLQKNEHHAFGVSFGDNRDKRCSDGVVKFTVYADEQREPHILNRLLREKRSGSVEKTGENLFTYTADVFDPNEMMTWVKTFIGRIVSFECQDKVIENRLKRDVQRMYEIYSKEGGTAE